MTPLERKQLIDSLLDGEISDADFLRIEAELSVDAVARQEYYDRAALSVLLEVEAGALGSGPESNSVLTPARLAVRRWRNAFVGMAVAVVVLLAVIGWFLNSAENKLGISTPDQTVVIAPVEEQATGFAVVVGQQDAVWKGRRPIADGALVSSGQWHLASGVVQFELFSGVTVVVEGEAEFAILSPMEMTVTRGKVRAHVPEPAHGFRIRTAEGEVVDLGTDFAVSVSAGQSEVHVLEGAVEWHPRASDLQRMQQGEAVRWSADGQGSPIEANALEFVGAVELREQLASARSAKREIWQQRSETSRHDPRLVAFYQMGAGDGRSRRLPNRAAADDVTAGEGAIVAATRSADRWGRPDGALDFSPTGSRVRVSVPGEYRSLTLLCWVKINSLDRWYNSLFLTDGHDLHEPHWQIMDDGRLFFSVKKRDRPNRELGEKDKYIYYSPSFWNSSLSGQWLMIATVYDVDARQVTHYLNGERLSQEAIPEDYLVEQVSIGNASLGNWGLPVYSSDPHFAVRNLNGSMDEFALFSAALSPEEIKEMYDYGKP